MLPEVEIPVTVDDDPTPAVEIVPKTAELPVLPELPSPALSQNELLRAEIRSMEDELAAQSGEILQDSLSFREIEPDADAPPQKWIDELGYERAIQKFRAAKASHMSAKEAPVALKIATQVFTSVAKARAVEKSGPRTLNVAIVEMTAPPNAYPVKKVER